MDNNILKNIPPLKLDYMLQGFSGGCGFGKTKWSLFEKWFIPDCITCVARIVYN